MNREDIIRMAREAGFQGEISLGQFVRLVRFAALVAAAEREACAKFCEDNQVFRGPKGSGFFPFHKETNGRHEGMEYAAAIRKRGEVKP